jgi:sec-independent protein translocase protein TatA
VKGFKDGIKDGAAPETPVPPAAQSQVTAAQPGPDKTTIDVEAKNRS